MKRVYLKPDIRLLQLRLNTFLTAGSGPSGDNASDTMIDGDGNIIPIENGTENSRSWGRGMWENMK